MDKYSNSFLLSTLRPFHAVKYIPDLIFEIPILIIILLPDQFLCQPCSPKCIQQNSYTATAQQLCSNLLQASHPGSVGTTQPIENVCTTCTHNEVPMVCYQLLVCRGGNFGVKLKVAPWLPPRVFMLQPCYVYHVTEQPLMRVP